MMMNNQNPNIEIIEFYIDKIASDELFSNSTQLVDLLRLLVKESLDGNQLKELTLGVKFFGEKYAEKDNGTARVYVYNLRKKLNLYYANSGADDGLKFNLEKGSYKVRFEMESHDGAFLKSIRSRRIIRIVVAAIFAIVLASIFIVQSSRRSYCWGKFFERGANNTCVLADHVTINYMVDSVKCVLSHPKITNETVLRRAIEDSVTLTQFTYFSKDIPISLYQLTKWFVANGSDIAITQESKLDYAETKRSNILYVGHYKTMGTSKQIFDRNNKWYRIDNNSIIVDRDGKRVEYRAKYNGTHVKTYAIVSYFALNEQHEALYFVSNSDVGIMATVSYFTDRKSLDMLYEDIPNGCHFNALFEVEGVDRTNASCRLVDIDIIY